MLVYAIATESLGSVASKAVIALVLFLLVILFRPEGLLGKSEERKV